MRGITDGSGVNTNTDNHLLAGIEWAKERGCRVFFLYPVTPCRPVLAFCSRVGARKPLYKQKVVNKGLHKHKPNDM